MKTFLIFLAGCLITGLLLGIHISNLNQKLAISQSQILQISQLTQKLSSCEARFKRTTVLYEQPRNIFGQTNTSAPPLKEWVIPADVQPQYVGANAAFFSHYDSNTQVETVKFPAQKQ